jgi:O-methyltransferase
VAAIGRGLRDWLSLYRHWLTAKDPLAKEDFGVALLERLRNRLAPRYPLGDFSKIWSDGHDMSRYAERRFLLSQLAAAVSELPGETAEAGVYAGTSSAIICRQLGRLHHAFDSFEGLSEPRPVDGGWWRAGNLAISERQARQLLEPLGARVYRGWIPAVFDQARIERLCLAHVDVDLYQPTPATRSPSSTRA